MAATMAAEGEPKPPEVIKCVDYGSSLIFVAVGHDNSGEAGSCKSASAGTTSTEWPLVRWPWSMRERDKVRVWDLMHGRRKEGFNGHFESGYQIKIAYNGLQN